MMRYTAGLSRKVIVVYRIVYIPTGYISWLRHVIDPLAFTNATATLAIPTSLRANVALFNTVNLFYEGRARKDIYRRIYFGAHQDIYRRIYFGEIFPSFAIVDAAGDISMSSELAAHKLENSVSSN